MKKLFYIGILFGFECISINAETKQLTSASLDKEQMNKEQVNVVAVENVNLPLEIPLWTDKQPQYQNGLPDDAEYMENPGWISWVTQPVLYIYPASNPSGQALVMCPGGGYAGVAIEHEGKALAELLNPNGVTLGVVKYRMPNGHPEVPAEDVWRALEIVNENAKEWGIDPSKIGIGGASAGGHLASTVATHTLNPDIAPAFQVLLYPVITMDESFTHSGSRELLLGPDPSEELVGNYSNEKQVTVNTPRAFIAVSGNDKVVPVTNSIDYFMALNEAEIPAAMFIYPTGGHGWGYSPEFLYNEQWTSELIKWLKQLP